MLKHNFRRQIVLTLKRAPFPPFKLSKRSFAITHPAPQQPSHPQSSPEIYNFHRQQVSQPKHINHTYQVLKRAMRTTSKFKQPLSPTKMTLNLYNFLIRIESRGTTEACQPQHDGMHMQLGFHLPRFCLFNIIS
jgi:hypothetical protein